MNLRLGESGLSIGSLEVHISYKVYKKGMDDTMRPSWPLVTSMG
jgi:hypothetical protein